MSLKLKKLMGWEGFLLVVLLLIISVNSFHSPAFLTVENQVNLFVLSVEKIIIALIMTFIILNAEICLLYTSPSPRDLARSRMPSSA